MVVPIYSSIVALMVVMSYDIACQFFINFFKRMGQYPPSFQLPQNPEDLNVFVPKYHLNAHTIDCRLKYSLNFSPNVGRTDGEAPERGWAAIDALAASTKEMGPGSRRDTLDDHFGDQNWWKVIDMRKSPVFGLSLHVSINYSSPVQSKPQASDSQVQQAHVCLRRVLGLCAFWFPI